MDFKMSPVAPTRKKKPQQEVSDCASAGLLGLINRPMIAPFLVTRADSENRDDNWIREISPWALKTVGLITEFLTGRTGSSLSAFQGGRNFFFFFFFAFGAPALVPSRGASCSQAYMTCAEAEQLLHLFRWIIAVTLESSHEENGSSQLEMGRETIYSGLWYISSGSYHLPLMY